MYYIIQEDTFKEFHYDRIIEAVDRLDLDYEIIQVLPFTEELEFQTKRKDVFLFGGMKLARIGKNFGWTPGSLNNDNHDYEVYKNYYKDNLLNFDSTVCNINDFIDFRKRKFIRPTLDNKSFTGAVFDYKEWDKKKRSCFKNKFVDNETKIQVSSVKKIYNESRFWIVGGKISTYSTYRWGGMISYKQSMVEEGAIDFCNEMIKKFQLASSFVMDIARTEEGYKIIECGCINCAGFYDSNLMKLITDLEDYYETATY